MNRLLLIGRIVRDVELKVVGPGEDTVLNNVLAVQRPYVKDQQIKTDFIPFVAWNQRAEIIENYCEKGDLIGLDGRLQTRQYEDKDGKKCFVTEMLIEHIQLLPNKRKKEE